MAVRSIVSLFFVLVFLGTRGQNGYIRLKSFQRIAYQNQASFAWSGAAIAGGAHIYLSRRDILDVGAEVGFLEWGGQTLINTGYLRKFPVREKLTLYTGGGLYNGMVLFRPKPLYSGAVEWQGGISGPVARRLDMAFFTGVRYSITPQYRAYSSVYTYWHFSAELVFIIKKPRRNPSPNPSF